MRQAEGMTAAAAGTQGGASTSTPAETFDFVIVGAGPAGCALARTLSFSPSAPRVLLLEAGDDQAAGDPVARVEQNKFVQRLSRTQNYHDSSEPAAELGGRRVPLDRGRGLGGGTNINFCAWTTGCRDEWDHLAERFGDGAWAWDRALDRYRALERSRAAESLPAGVERYVRPRPEWHGDGGPLNVGYTTAWERNLTRSIDIFEGSGRFPINPDPSGGDPLGVAPTPMASWRGVRTSAADLLIDAPANLTVVCDALVHKVLFEKREEGEDEKDEKEEEKGKPRAVGVVLADGRVFRAAKEVVLSGGSLNSPKVLMLSGVGPAEQLAEHGVGPALGVAAGPHVGSNLCDHYHIRPTWEWAAGTSERPAFFRDRDRQRRAQREWDMYRSGEMAHLGNGYALGFLKSAAVAASPEFAALDPEVRDRLSRPTVPTYEISLGIVAEDYYACPDAAPVVEVVFVFLHNAQGRGRVCLRSADPAAPPAVHLDVLRHPYDRRAALEATREVLAVTSSEAYRAEAVGGPRNAPRSDSDEDILAYWRDHLESTWHMSGTCKMGPAGDDTAVVDTDFRVRGTRGLRVADMSVFPFIMSQHTMTSAFQVGLIAAEKLVAEYQLDVKG